MATVRPAEREENLILNMGPQHPSTHGVLRLVVELDGENVVRLEPVIGYLHTGFEKTFEYKNYHQGLTLTPRMDYLNNLGNELAYSLALEKLLEIEAPPRATVARVILAELTRIASHLVGLGTQAIELGAQSVFLYAFREREQILDIFELCSGARMMCNYIRAGGLSLDLPEGFREAVEAVLAMLPARIDDYESLLTTNALWRDRTVGVGKLSLDDAMAYCVTGPCLRACGLPFDLRKARPYCGYEEYDFAIPVGTNGDVFDRYAVRVREMRESLKIIRQALDRLPEGPWITDDRKVAFPPRSELATSMEAVIHWFKLASEGFRVPRGEVYLAVESPRGELGYYIISDGSAHPYRVHVRGPSFANLEVLPVLAKGELVADLVATIGSLDPVMGEVDR